MDSLPPTDEVGQILAAEAADRLSRFREQMYGCLGRRADELFELTDAVLCADGPVRSLVGLCLAPEHRRGHGALYDALNCGTVDADRLREIILEIFERHIILANLLGANLALTGIGVFDARDHPRLEVLAFLHELFHALGICLLRIRQPLGIA